MDDNLASMRPATGAPAALFAEQDAAAQPPEAYPEGGYGLFRQAVYAHDNAAWEELIARYRHLVLSWVRQHPSAAVMEDEDYWVTRAFERFRTAIGPVRFGQFPDVAALLRYLKLCAYSVLMDEVRARHAEQQVDSHGAVPFERGPVPNDVTLFAAGRLDRQALWAALLQVLADDSERLVVYLSRAGELKLG